MPVNKTRGKYVGSALLRERVLAERLTGKTVRQIAVIVGRSYQRVHQILQSALAELKEKATEQTEEIVAIELQRLDSMLEALWPLRGFPEHAGAILRLMDRRAKLLGLDAPTKTGFIGKDGQFTDPPTLVVQFTDGSSSQTDAEPKPAEGV